MRDREREGDVVCVRYSGLPRGWQRRIGAGRVGMPLDAVCEVLRETRRLVFQRGIVEQDGHMVAAFNGTVRKASAR